MQSLDLTFMAAALKLRDLKLIAPIEVTRFQLIPIACCDNTFEAKIEAHRLVASR
jgi:hypothetical protein